MYPLLLFPNKIWLYCLTRFFFKKETIWTHVYLAVFLYSLFFYFFNNRSRLVVLQHIGLRKNLGKEDLDKFMLVAVLTLQFRLKKLVQEQ